MGDKRMRVYAKMRCEECENEYKGLFLVQNNGRIVCYDCNKPVKLGKVGYERVSLQDQGVTQEVVKELLRKDLNRIYLTNVEEGKDELHKIRDENNNIDPAKMYFQNNDLELILRMQKSAYVSLTYMEAGNDLPYYKYAKKVFNKYMESRQRKFTKKEIREIEDLLVSGEMQEIEIEVEG